MSFLGRDTPIKIFQSEKELNACMKQWQSYLGLEDWSMLAKLEDYIEDDSGKELAGQNQFEAINKTSIIRLKDQRADKDALEDSYLLTVCQECVLIHEMLHCKIGVIYNTSTYEGRAVDLRDHADIEWWARTLIAIAYDLPVRWYDNTETLIAINNAKEDEHK